MIELIVFAVVGVLATLTHYCVAIAAVELLFVSVYLANILAYCSAVSVSYVGHTAFTFKAEMSKRNAVRFLVVSISALALSQLVLGGLEWGAWFGHRINFLVVVFVIPVYSYFLNKFWVYK